MVPGVEFGGEKVKKVEDLSTDDFIKASKSTDDAFADLAKLVNIVITRNSAKLVFTIGQDDTKVTLVCDDDQPFFVFCAGWSSLSPLLTKAKYNLSSNVLSVGDICMVLRIRRGVHNVDDARADNDNDNDQPTDLTIKKSTDEN